MKEPEHILVEGRLSEPFPFAAKVALPLVVNLDSVEFIGKPAAVTEPPLPSTSAGDAAAEPGNQLSR